MRGRFYQRIDSNLNDFQTTAGDTLSVGDNGDGQLIVSGGDARGAFSGLWDQNPGLFMLQGEAPGSENVAAVPANADGTLQLSGGNPPGDLPPAVTVVDGRIWPFLGLWESTAFYGSATEAHQSPWLLQIGSAGSGAAAFVDELAETSAPGSYSSSTHLFQTSGPQSGFPVPVYGVDPNDNNRLWGLPEAPEDLPDTFLVGNEVWRFAGVDANGAALYQGYYGGQVLAVDAPDADGLRLVSVTDPVHGNTNGTLNDVRGSVRLRDGRMAYSGDFDGDRVNPVFNQANLYTIAADVDITGNVLSFGALSGDAAVAGVTWQFVDDGSTATLHNALGRPQAQWVWSRAGQGAAQPPLAVMKLDASSRLTLYDPNSGAAGVVLNPAENGVSTLRGVLRVRPGGDIGMGEFTAGGEP